MLGVEAGVQVKEDEGVEEREAEVVGVRLGGRGPGLEELADDAGAVEEGEDAREGGEAGGV